MQSDKTNIYEITTKDVQNLFIAVLTGNCAVHIDAQKVVVWGSSNRGVVSVRYL